MNVSELIGMRVVNRQTKAIGVIDAVDNNILHISFHGEIHKYLYPSCFATTLELDEEELQEEIEKEGLSASFELCKKNFKHAIGYEINHLKVTGGRKYKAMDGVLLPSQRGEYIYAFDTDTDMHFPDGTALKIWMPDRIIGAYIVSCEEFTIVLRSMEFLGESIESIEVTSEQWMLLEALSDRLDEMEPRIESIAYEVACKGNSQINRHMSIQCGQNLAYRRATSEPITFIWGPPGTGKTEILSNIALDHIEQGKRVLMVSYSNVSVDGALLRVAKKADYSMGTLVRYGYPRVRELLEDNRQLTSYQCVLSKNPVLAAEFKSLIVQKRKLKKKDPERIKINKRLAKIREKLMEQEKILIQNAQFVATTVSKAIVDKTVYSQKFDVVIFDEASMAYVPQVVFAAGLAKQHFICLGDFCQLPAIVQNKDDDRLTKDIFEYTRITDAVENNWGHNWLVMLNVQYRMHREIANLVNKYMYGGRLITSDEIFASRNEIAACSPMAGEAISMVDLSFCYSVCINTMDGSRINLLSALMCLRIAATFLDKYEVGIITPYSAQSRLILSMIRDMKEKDARYEQITSATVHQFQGSEKPIIIYDAVDCFRMPFPGTLLTSLKNNIANRMYNVALTRAKGKFILVANRDYFIRKNVSNKLIFTRTLGEIRNQGKSIEGLGILEEFYTEIPDKSKSMYLENREESWDVFCDDLRNASKKIHIDIPGVIDENDDAIEELSAILEKKDEAGIDISIRLEEDVTLPDRLHKYAQNGSYVTTPITFVDHSVIWFGQPLSAADFITEGDILETKYFPCLRFEGSITARALQAFLEI